MSAAPYMQFYVGDYIQKTLHLTTEQHGAYLLLLMALWNADANLPNDQAKLARIARVSPKRWPLVWGEISGFFTIADGHISQDRLTKEHQKVLSISQERKLSGSIGGTAKALKDKDARLASATILPDVCHGISEPEPEEEKREAKASQKKRGSRLPNDWFLPKAWGDWALSEGCQIEFIRTEAANFKDYWNSAAGQSASKLDWEATWRIWIRKELKKQPKPRKSDNAQFGAAIHQLADHLSAGTARIDLASRDPFAVRPGPNPAPDEQRSFPLLRS